MAKPIFIVRLPEGTYSLEGVMESLSERLIDYHVLALMDNLLPAVSFEVFYEKDMTDIKFDELKEYVTKLIKEQ